jgi:hypothetical protein
MQDEIAAQLVRDVRAAVFDREDEALPASGPIAPTGRLTSALPLPK